MKTLIVYATRYGCTEKCAGILAGKLEGEVDLCGLIGGAAVDPAPYDRVIVGGSVYIGKIQKEVGAFCSKNLELLKQKKLGLFICNMREGAEAEAELNSSFPPELLRAAAAKDYFGGAFAVSRMKPMDRFITRTVAKVTEDTSSILAERIDRFARAMNGARA